MEKINSSALKKGMRFTGAVFFDDQKNLFLPVGCEVSDFHLDVLRKWKIPFVFMNGRIRGDSEPDDVPELEELAEIEELEEVEDCDELEELSEVDEVLSALTIKKDPLYDGYKDLIIKMNSVFERIRLRNGAGVNSELETITAGIFAFSSRETAAVQCLLTREFPEYQFAATAIDCAVLTCLISSRLKQPQRVIELNVTGALLHDIGMLWQNEKIIKKTGALLPEEFTQLKSHTIEASRFVSDVLHLPREVSVVILQHHENWNGKGYPTGKSGESIDMGARIVAVADAFQAMISRKTYRNSLIAYDAMKNIINDNAKRYCPDVTKAFVICMGVFPFGSLVLLNNSAIAKVIITKTTAPLRPTIRILIGADGTVYKNDSGEQINLETNRQTFIVKVLAPEEVKGLD